MIMTPILSLHGTSADELIQQRIDACAAIRDAMQALSATSPNGRDYIGHPSLYEADRAIYAERFAALDRLHNELMAEAEKIMLRAQK